MLFFIFYHFKMSNAKVILSEHEQQLVTNSEWILTKNAVMEKGKMLLNDVQEEYRNLLSDLLFPLPEEVNVAGGKLSKGENYKGLPYLLLDYPGYFDKENIFAFRTMFWWGHFFSVTLHLSGKFKQRYIACIEKKIEENAYSDYFISAAEDQWQHGFETKNYRKISGLTPLEIINNLQQKSFIKIACKLPAGQWNNAQEFCTTGFISLLKILQG
jgi:hypothetical protein